MRAPVDVLYFARWNFGTRNWSKSVHDNYLEISAHQDRVPKDITMPYPPQPILTELSDFLHVVYGRCYRHNPIRSKFRDTQEPINADERSDPGNTNKMRDIWVPRAPLVICMWSTLNVLAFW
jgi:hypothetical protein